MGVQTVVINTQIRRLHVFVSHGLLYELQLANRYGSGEIEFVSPVTGKNRIGIFDGVVDNFFYGGIGIISKQLIALQFDVRLHHPVAEHISTITHQFARAGELLAVLLNTRRVHRISHAVAQQPQEIGGWACQRNFQRQVVNGTHAQCFRGHISTIDRCGIFYRRQDAAVNRQGCRVQRASQAEYPVIGGDRVTIAPPAILAEFEGVHLTAFIQRPGLRCTGNQFAVRRFHHQ